jgi:hypothetical protein
MREGAVVHHDVAVIACDSAVTLKETLHRLADLEVDAVTVGDRHVVLPASQVSRVLERMKEFGQFPRLVGEDARPVSGTAEQTDHAGDDE